MTIDCAVPAEALLGECPLWSPTEQVVYWIDIDGRRIHRFDPRTGVDDRRETAGRPGSLALTDTPGVLLLAMEHELGWFSWEEGSFSPWLQLEPPATGNRLNDGRCDRNERFWVGSMWEATVDNKFTGVLHSVAPSGTATTVRRDVGVSNGLAFSPEGTTMYFADTLYDTIWAYDYDPATGDATNERVFSDFAGLPGRPDGACVDVDGGYWIACVHGGAVARLTPHGDIDRIIEVPTARPTMPAFGGPGLDVLYVTSIGAGGSRPATDLHPWDGGLLALDVGVSGLAETPFAGTP
ncbi:MAG TPA: SMP-30/gluconolactonase/LRE family protein [Acidimicrobiia bacterium]|nr:SMP-30/gluconolactonase/LRE family protein [Acidimicrobiia bacterium]